MLRKWLRELWSGLRKDWQGVQRWTVIDMDVLPRYPWSVSPPTAYVDGEPGAGAVLVFEFEVDGVRRPGAAFFGWNRVVIEEESCGRNRHENYLVLILSWNHWMYSQINNLVRHNHSYVPITRWLPLEGSIHLRMHFWARSMSMIRLSLPLVIFREPIEIEGDESCLLSVCLFMISSRCSTGTNFGIYFRSLTPKKTR